MEPKSLTLQVEHQQLPTRVLVGPVAEGQHGLLQQVGGVDLLAVVVVELAELPGDALLDGEPLTGRVAVEQEHLEEPEDGRVGSTADNANQPGSPGNSSKLNSHHVWLIFYNSAKRPS